VTHSEAEISHVAKIIENGWDPRDRGYPDDLIREARRRVSLGWRAGSSPEEIDAFPVRANDPAEWLRRDEGKGYGDSLIYYLRFCCRVKIGRTRNLATRLESLPHHEVLATESGGPSVEAGRHRQFGALHDMGEWFTYGPELQAHVRTLQGASPILADTEAAARWSGRDIGVIYRWANEGRLTRYGGRGKGGSRWDLREIPQWDGPGSGKPRPKAPGKKLSG
jgi:hypothetical protein